MTLDRRQEEGISQWQVNSCTPVFIGDSRETQQPSHLARNEKVQTQLHMLPSTCSLRLYMGFLQEGAKPRPKSGTSTEKLASWRKGQGCCHNVKSTMAKYPKKV
eukprot:1055746-Amphidinium_carterae.1